MGDTARPAHTPDRDEQPANEAKECKLSVRVSRRGKKFVEDEADLADVKVSHYVRRMMTFAMLNMPRGWVPPRATARRRPAR